jgi:hypothetical protein
MAFQGRSPDPRNPDLMDWYEATPRHSWSRKARARRILTVGLVERVGGMGPRPGDPRPLLSCLPGDVLEGTPR